MERSPFQSRDSHISRGTPPLTRPGFIPSPVFNNFSAFHMRTSITLRGEATLLLVLILAVTGGASLLSYNYGKKSAEVKNTAEIKDLSVTSQKANEAAEAAQAKLTLATKAHADAVASTRAKEQAAAGFIAGTKIALDHEPTPSIHVRIAKVMNENAGKSFDTVTAAQLKEFEEIIKDLTDKNDTTSLALQTKVAEADVLKVNETSARKAAAEAELKAAEASNQVVALTDKVKTQAGHLVELTNNNKTFMDRVKTWAIVLALLWIASIALPLLAKAFPILQPLASVFGAIWAPGVQAVAAGAKKLSTDMVALHEYVKEEMAEDLGPDKVAALKAKVKKWWDGDIEGQHAVEKIKAETLRA